MSTNKKDDHVYLAEKFHLQRGTSDFDCIRFVYNSFPEMGINEANIKTCFAGLNMENPFFINAMTGGSEKTKEVNKKLALVARETNLAMASGSLSVAIKDPTVLDSFQIIRETNPNGLIFANLGAEHSVEGAKRAIDILEAQALQIHVNVLQELIMPEGDRDFSNWLKSIEKIVKAISIPVIVKEVGFGMSKKTISQLKHIGVGTIDISGAGGTNFAKIENYRREKNKYDYLEDFGQSTVVSLLEAETFIDNTNIIASGGIRNPLDIVKSLSLGAKAVGVSGTILKMVLDLGVENTILELNNWKEDIRLIMTLLGKKKIEDLVHTDLVLVHDVREWCMSRGIEYEKFANRDE